MHNVNNTRAQSINQHAYIISQYEPIADKLATAFI